MKLYLILVTLFVFSFVVNAQNNSEVTLDGSDSNTITVSQQAKDSSNISKVKAEKSKGNKVGVDQRQAARADSIDNKKPKSFTDYASDSDTIFKAVISLLTIGTLLFAFRDRFKPKKKRNK